MEFSMAGSDDAADDQHLQRGAFLLCGRSAQFHVMDQRREDVHRAFLLA
jgi:hypothetical protein